MFGRHLYPSRLRFAGIAAALLLFIGGSHSTNGQIPNLARQVSRPRRASNPVERFKRSPSKPVPNRAKQTPVNVSRRQVDERVDEQQQAVELAIKQGNQARDANIYDHALAHYQEARRLKPQDARAYYGMGNLYADLFCNDSAIEAYRKALELKKDYLEAHIGLAYVYGDEERYDEALKQFQLALAISSDDVEANIGIGLVYAAKEKYQEAIERISRVVNARSVKDRAAAHVALGKVYREQGKPKEAIAQFEKAVILQPDLAEAYFNLALALLSFDDLSDDLDLKEAKTQDLEKLRTTAKKAADNIKRAIDLGYDKPEADWILGLTLIFQFRYQDAISQTNSYLAKVKAIESRLPSLSLNCGSGFNRFNAAGHLLLSLVYAIESDFETDKQRAVELLNKAIEQTNQAIRLKQDIGPAYHLLSGIYERQGNYEEAIRQAKKAIIYETKASSKADYYATIGELNLKTGKYAEAAESLQEAIKLNPHNSAPYLLLGRVYSGQAKWDEAISLFKKAIEIKPEPNARAYTYLGTAYFVRAEKKESEVDFEEAMRLLKKAIEIKPDYADAYFVLGLAYKSFLAHFNADMAIANFEQAARYDPKNPDIYFEMANAYSFPKHNYDAAIPLLKKAIELKPDYAEAYLQLGQAYDSKGDEAEAIKQVLKAIEIAPKYLDSYLQLAELYQEQEKYPEAIKYLKRATEIAPTDPEPYEKLAELYEKQGKNEKVADNLVEAANRLDAADAINKKRHLGQAARLRRQYTESIRYFQEMIPLGQSDEAHYEMGLTYVASKNKNAALEQYQQIKQARYELKEHLLYKIKEIK